MGDVPLNGTKVLKTRLAPTPSGFLHYGNLINFALIWVLAKKFQAKILLRIDDLDTDRFRPDYLEDIFHVLDDLGFSWDQGPSGPDDYSKKWSQRFRLEEYQLVLAKIWEKGNLFACECSRKDYNSNLGYTGTCVAKDLNFLTGQHQLRWNNPPLLNWQLGHSHSIGSFDLSKMIVYPVLLQKNNRPSFQISSLSDDLHYGVNLIIRGDDLYASSLVQDCLKNQILGLAGNAWTYVHHGILKEGGQKISKSSGHQSQSLRGDSHYKEKFWKLFNQFLGLSGDHRVGALEELADHPVFSLLKF